jgi:TM2 domain-containing membrane protein YozV
MKSKTTAAIWAFFLGGFGAHRFYLNQTGLGFLYLLTCWTFIPLVVAFVDFIIFLTMSEADFDRKYNYQRFVPTPSQPQSTNSASAVNISFGEQEKYFHHNTADEIKKLYEMKEKGIISQEEFDLKKKMLL